MQLKNLREEHPSGLAERLKENILLPKDIFDDVKFKQLPANNRQKCTPKSISCSSPKSRLVVFDGDLKIEFNVLRNAIARGRDADNKDSLNAMVGAIIDFFMPLDEQATYSLTGRPCRSIVNSLPKKKFPSHLKTALNNFIPERWKKWHSVTNFDTSRIKQAIIDKLQLSGSKVKNAAKKRTLPKENDEDLIVTAIEYV